MPDDKKCPPHRGSWTGWRKVGERMDDKGNVVERLYFREEICVDCRKVLNTENENRK